MYDAKDYIEEFEELTDLGLSCREIVTRSIPSANWFRKHVFPYAKKAICINCRCYFNPSVIRRGTECSAMCRNSYVGAGSGRM